MTSLITLGCAGCAPMTAGAPTPSPQEMTFTGTYASGCSPVDATGIIFDLTTPQLAGWFQISMWGDFGLEEGAVVPLAMEEAVAVAAFCRATNDCQVARQGELRITQAEGSILRGSLWLVLPDTESIQGLFEVEWIDAGPVICG